MKNLEHFTTHDFQAVSVKISGGVPPQAVITSYEDSWECKAYYLSQLLHYNKETQIAYYQGQNVISFEEAKELCEGNFFLKRNHDITVVSFYETVEEAKEEMKFFQKQYFKEREEND